MVQRRRHTFDLILSSGDWEYHLMGCPPEEDWEDELDAYETGAELDTALGDVPGALTTA